jgi:hypothetical protein
MAKRGVVGAAADTVVSAAKTSAEGVRLLAGDAASSVAKAATGAVLGAVKGAQRLVRGKPVRRKTKRRAKGFSAAQGRFSQAKRKTRGQENAPQGGAQEVAASGQRAKPAKHQRQI